MGTTTDDAEDARAAAATGGEGAAKGDGETSLTNVLYRPSRGSADDRLHHAVKRRPRGDEDDAEACQTLAPSPSAAPTLLPTLTGVFLPCCQNIMGIVLFLRLSWITGQAGVALAVTIVLLSVLCTSLTTLSLSALATNGKIKGGGAYHVISRSLGPAVGAAVGVCFYLGTAAASSLYVLGAVEAVVDITGIDLAGSWTLQVLGEILTAALAGMVLLGTKHVARIGPAALAAVVLAVVSIYMGVATLGTSESNFTRASAVSASRLSDNSGPEFSAGNSFGSLLALFFPSVTGIMSGSNRSAVLRDPSRSIPLGTLAAVAVTGTIYVSFPVLLGGSVPREDLLDDLFIVPKVSWPVVELVEVAIVLSALGAALQTMAGAPQLLNAIAGDFLKDIPALGRLHNAPGTEPRRALALTVAIVAALVLSGNLDVVAPFVTMFLLICYAAVNFSVVLNAALARPSWRPTWRYYHPLLSLAALVLCVVLMFIDPAQAMFALAALALAAGIAFYTHYRGVERDWGDGLRGLRLAAAVRNVRALGDSADTHAINWRPQALLLLSFGGGRGGEADEGAALLFRALALFGKANSLSQAVALVEDPRAGGVGDNAGRRNDEWRAERARVAGVLEALNRESHTRALLRTIRVPSVPGAASLAVQAAGVGAVTPNLALLGWPARWATQPAECQTLLESLRGAREADKAALVVMRAHLLPEPLEEQQSGGRGAGASGGNGGPGEQRRVIDVWWEAADGGLQILLAQTIRRQRGWRSARLRIHTAAFPLDNSLEIERRLVEHLRAARIDAEVVVVEFDADSSLTPYVHQRTLQMEQRHKLLKQLALVRTTPQGHTVYVPQGAAAEEGEPPLSELERARTMGRLRKEEATGGGASVVSRSTSSVRERVAEASARSPPSGARIGHKRPGAAHPASALASMFTAPELGGDEKLDEADEKTADGGGGGDAGDGGGGDSEPPETEMGDIDGAEDEEATARRVRVAFADHRRTASTDSVAVIEGRDVSMLDRPAPRSVENTEAARKRRMLTALTYNRHLRESSAKSDLLITNLPSLHLYPSEEEWFSFVEVLTEGLGAVMLARGSRKEVITTYV